MDTQHVNKSLFHSKIAIYTIIGFLIIVTLLLISLSRVATEQALHYRAQAYPGYSAITDDSELGRARQAKSLAGTIPITVAPVVARGEPIVILPTPTTAISGGMSIERCTTKGGKCLPRNVCGLSGGTIIEQGPCSSNGFYMPNTVCCRVNPNDDRDLVVSDTDCVKYGGTCRHVDPTNKSVCNIFIGVCTPDGGISSSGWCCKDTISPSPTPFPTAVPIARPLSCKDQGGDCIATCPKSDLTCKISGEEACGDWKYLGDCPDGTGPDWKYVCCKK